jgi:hypothetical protein
LTDLWSAAKARGKQEREKTRPFYVYIDECQNFITPTIAKNLDQARGFGLHLTLANQFPSQFLNEGPNGKAMYDSILANAGTKIVFRVEHPDDMKSLAQWLFMSTLDTDQIKLKLDSTKVMGYREEIRESRTTGHSVSEGTGSNRGGGRFAGLSAGTGQSGSQSFDPNEMFADPFVSAEGWNNYLADSSGEAENWSESSSRAETESESVTTSSVLLPVMGRETSNVQFRSIEEQLFRAMQTLFDQEDRHFAVRFHGGPKGPLFVKTPTVRPVVTRLEKVEAYRGQLLRKLAYALPMPEAITRLNSREQRLLTEAVVDLSPSGEPTTAKRRIRCSPLFKWPGRATLDSERELDRS